MAQWIGVGLKEREREKYKLSIHTKCELGGERERERERRLTLIRISDGERDIESVENVGHVRGGHQLLQLTAVQIIIHQS